MISSLPSNGMQNTQDIAQGTLRIREDPASPAPRPSRKRKASPTNSEPNVLPNLQQMINPMGSLPPGYQYSSDFSPGGLPPPAPPTPQDDSQHQSQSPPPNSQAGRALSSSKRAEQNRKAQRAFRERRDQSVFFSSRLLRADCGARHVKSLESRSALLDAALASADEANRRWEECRVLVDQLRVENAALRAALSQQKIGRAHV